MPIKRSNANAIHGMNFSNALKAEASHGLAYETEYVIAGKRSDRENLEEVVKKLVLLRFAADYVYLLTD